MIPGGHEDVICVPVEPPRQPLHRLQADTLAAPRHESQQLACGTQAHTRNRQGKRSPIFNNSPPQSPPIVRLGRELFLSWIWRPAALLLMLLVPVPLVFNVGYDVKKGTGRSPATAISIDAERTATTVRRNNACCCHCCFCCSPSSTCCRYSCFCCCTCFSSCCRWWWFHYSSSYFRCYCYCSSSYC